MRRHTGECLDVTADVIEELRTPRAQRNDVHQHHLLVVDPAEQMGAQHDRAAHVVGDDAGLSSFQKSSISAKTSPWTSSAVDWSADISDWPYPGMSNQ